MKRSEPMTNKKDIWDLTDEEMRVICLKHWNKITKCFGCKLNLGKGKCLKVYNKRYKYERGL